MYRLYEYRYFFGLSALIILLILLIILIAGSGAKTTKTLPKTLDSYATSNAQVSMTIVGPIYANQVHQEAVITVNNTNATYQQIQGYQGKVVNQQSFSDNTNSYREFLFALESADFTRGNKSSSLKNDLGYCPLGDRYIFELTQDSQTLERYWATSCGGTRSYLGNFGLTVTLFENQIPNFDNLAAYDNI